MNASSHELWPNGRFQERNRYIAEKNRDVPRQAYFACSSGFLAILLYKETRVRQTKAKAKNNSGCPIKKKTGVATVASAGPIDGLPS